LVFLRSFCQAFESEPGKSNLPRSIAPFTIALNTYWCKYSQLLPSRQIASMGIKILIMRRSKEARQAPFTFPISS
jgi:hypothetical protein